YRTLTADEARRVRAGEDYLMALIAPELDAESMESGGGPARRRGDRRGHGLRPGAPGRCPAGPHGRRPPRGRRARHAAPALRCHSHGGGPNLRLRWRRPELARRFPRRLRPRQAALQRRRRQRPQRPDLVDLTIRRPRSTRAVLRELSGSTSPIIIAE